MNEECVGLKKNYVIKKKFQDTCLQCTSLAPIVGHWSHALLLEELVDFSNALRQEPKSKVNFL